MLQKHGYDLTLSVLESADHGALVGVMHQALNEPDRLVRDRTAARLARIENEAVERLLVRRFQDVGREARAALLKRPEAILRAAERLSAVGDRQIRANVVEALAALADRRAIPLMLRYLDDPSAPVRARARSLLHLLSRRYGSQVAAEGGTERAYLRTALGLALRSGDVTAEGLGTILALGRDGALLLVPLLRDEASEAAGKIAQFLRQEATREAAACLLFLASSSYEPIRRLARAILKDRRDGPFLVALAEVIAETPQSELASLVVTLRHLPWQVLTPEDVNRLDETCQRAVLEIARSFGGTAVQRVAKLVPFLKSRITAIRAEALHALSDMPVKLIFPHVEPLLNDPAEVIALRVTSLLHIEDNPRVLRLLAGQLGHASDLVREQASRQLSGRTFHILSSEWHELPQEKRARLAAKLARIDRRFMAHLRAELESADTGRIQHALAMARATDDVTSLEPALIDLATFPDAHVRSATAVLLGRIGTRQCRRLLERLLGDRDARVVSNGIEALAGTGDAGFIPRLQLFLEHRHHRVRATAIVSLRQLGYGGIYDPLRAMLRQGDPAAQHSARWAVGMLRTAINRERNAITAPAFEEIDWREFSADTGGQAHTREGRYAQS